MARTKTQIKTQHKTEDPLNTGNTLKYMITKTIQNNRKVFDNLA